MAAPREMPDILVSEVGPRDGLQSVKRTMPTAVKHRWIAALAQAGLREIEVGSFVSPKRLPQMADTEVVVREAIKIPSLTVLALVPNLKGAERAVPTMSNATTTEAVGFAALSPPQACYLAKGIKSFRAVSYVCISRPLPPDLRTRIASLSYQV